MFRADIIADSYHDQTPDKQKVRLTTFRLTYPRFTHAELMTHRVFSRNSSSSRAIPLKKMIRDILTNPVSPVWWGQNQKGMQAKVELKGFRKWAAKQVWFKARYAAIAAALMAEKIGLHKQIANRLLEPWMWITVVVTSVDYDNWFALRDHPDAQPEIAYLARLMRAEYDKSTPQRLDVGEYHLPFVTIEEKLQYRGKDYGDLIALSVARCARTSYNIHENGKARASTFDEDLNLFERLVVSKPLHASPAEHQAMPDVYGKDGWENPHLHGNLPGWMQYRKFLPDEFVGVSYK